MTTSVWIDRLNDIIEGTVPVDNAELEIFVDGSEEPIMINLSPSKKWQARFVILEDGEGGQVTVLSNFSPEKGGIIWYSVARSSIVIPADGIDDPQAKPEFRAPSLAQLRAA